MQNKSNNQKISKKKKKKKSFQVTKRFVFLFFGPLLLSNLITFLFLIHFKQLKFLLERHLKFYKSCLNFNRKKTTKKELSGCLKIGLCNVQWFFSEFLTPFTLGGHNFLISNSFSTILSVLDAPRRGLQVLFRHQKQKNPPSAVIL